VNYKGIVNLFAALASKNRKISDLLQNISREISPDTVILLEYPISSKQRWDLDHPNQELYTILDDHRDIYTSNLLSFLSLSEYFVTIPEHKPQTTLSDEPYWINGWLPPLDGIALYSFLVTNKPKYYLEIGSGNSTKFARKAISDHNLDTKLISIDPHPRAEIDNICDEMIRKPVESVPVDVFNRLNANDILFVDGSHRVFMNSDATILFLDVIPRLNPGVLVEIHDVTLPYDYPANWVERYYSEQYLLAAYILAKGNMFDIILPNYFISRDNELKRLIWPLRARGELKNISLSGSSFWIRIK
jgi:hypothetical protein